MEKFFYARVSSSDQNLERQLEKARELDISEKNIYCDKASGKNFNRHEYLALKRTLREGDILYISSLDRLGRNYEAIKKEWDELINQARINIVVLDMPLLDTTKQADDLNGRFISDLVLQILSYVAETERANIKRRQKEGIDIARKKGIYGRPKIDINTNFIEVCTKWENNEITAVKAMRELGMKRNTFYRRVNEYNSAKKEAPPYNLTLHKK